jgi:hypothetical protein
MTDLSPAAQAIYEAWRTDKDGPWTLSERERLAAALRAAADQVVPPDTDYASNEVLMIALNVRHQFHAIAAELEDAQ